jgi:hypothetical protein
VHGGRRLRRAGGRVRLLLLELLRGVLLDLLDLLGVQLLLRLLVLLLGLVLLLLRLVARRGLLRRVVLVPGAHLVRGRHLARLARLPGEALVRELELLLHVPAGRGERLAGLAGEAEGTTDGATLSRLTGQAAAQLAGVAVVAGRRLDALRGGIVGVGLLGGLVEVGVRRRLASRVVVGVGLLGGLTIRGDWRLAVLGIVGLRRGDVRRGLGRLAVVGRARLVSRLPIVCRARVVGLRLRRLREERAEEVALVIVLRRLARRRLGQLLWLLSIVVLLGARVLRDRWGPCRLGRLRRLRGRVR